MEWNTKSPSQWDWELIFNTKETENSKSQPPNLSGEVNREIDVGLFDASGGSGCSESELIPASSSRSSKSASINSSSNRDSKTSLFAFESSQDDSSGIKELSKEDPVENSHALEPSSGEPLLTLKLGKRSYFEDICPGSDSKNLSFSGASMSSISTGKKFKSSGQNVQTPQCQVEGCGLDLSSAKDYHRKHRVCEAHSKSPKVVINGLERRFCQQCSRFHGLLEFDEKKRSCRRRLSDHNARRRKPLPEVVHISQSALPSAACDERQQMNPFTYPGTTTNLPSHEIQCSKLPQIKDFLMKPAKANDIPSIVTVLSGDSNNRFTSKGLATKSINPGIEDTVTSDPYPAQDSHRALSLLSTNSWASYETRPISQEHLNHTTSTAQHITYSMTQRAPLAAPSEYWYTDQQVNPSMLISFSDCDDSNRFHEFQLFRDPYESDFTYDQ